MDFSFQLLSLSIIITYFYILCLLVKVLIELFILFLSWASFWQMEKAMAPHSSTFHGKSHGWRSLVGCSPWGRYESDTTERLHFHFSLSCIGEGNGNPLQYSCLENPRDGGAWWLPSMGSHRVGHDWSDLAAAAADQWSLHLINCLYLFHSVVLGGVWSCSFILKVFLCFFILLNYLHIFLLGISTTSPGLERMTYVERVLWGPVTKSLLVTRVL